MSSTFEMPSHAAFLDSSSPANRQSFLSLDRKAAEARVSDSRSRLGAGVVFFHFDSHPFEHLLETLKSTADTVYVVLNSPMSPCLRDRLEEDDRVRLLGSGRNLGIGAALNMIISAAQSDHFERLFLFDQDSRPTAATMDKVFQAALALELAGETPAVVAPHLIAPHHGPESKAPTYQTWFGHDAVCGHRPVAFVPTSGSLLDLTQLNDIGVFRADYFIDGVDLEWCFRAWSRGHSCWLASGATMEHPIGKGLIRWPLPRFAMPKQEVFRMYCYIRNTTYGLRLPHVPLIWKAKQLAYVPLQMLAYVVHHKFNSAVIKQLAAGVADGLSGRLGPPANAPWQ